MAKIRNDGLGPAINPASIYWLKPVVRDQSTNSQGEWTGPADIVIKVAELLGPNEAKLYSIGRGGVFAKDRELEIFSCRPDALSTIDTLELLLIFRGLYGALYEKRITIVPPAGPARAAAGLPSV